MKIKKLIELETVYGRDYQFYLLLEDYVWKDIQRVMLHSHEYILETYRDDADITAINVLDLN